MRPMAKAARLVPFTAFCLVAGFSPCLAQPKTGIAFGISARKGPAATAGPVKTIRVNGVQLAYVDRGHGEPIVLAHGFLHDYRVWPAQVETLSKQYRVIAYSQRYRYPFAPAPENADISRAASVEDLAALIQRLKLGRVHLVGHSGGAALILSLARKHPHLVRSLVLGEGPPPLSVAAGEKATAPPPPAFVLEARQAYDRGDREGAIRTFAQGVLGKDRPLPPRPSLREIPLDNAWQLRTLGVRDTSEAPFTCDDARRIQAPALVVRGELSPPVQHANAEAWRNCAPAVEHAVLSGASHGLQIENPAGFNEIVSQFLARQHQRTRAQRLPSQR